MVGWTLIGLLAGFALGGTVAWLVGKARSAPVVARLMFELDHERAATAEKLAVVDDARERLTATFKALSADALSASNASFLQLAKAQLEQVQLRASSDLQERQRAVEHLVGPIRESLEKVDGKLRELEQVRTVAYSTLTEQVRSLAEGQRELRLETASLVTALRSPTVRGRWGEMQLRRVVEAAGMLSHCDFAEQATIGHDGRLVRPDLIVYLAGGKNVVVDAKVPLQAYLDALEARDDATREQRLADHARQLREHVRHLSSKSYWSEVSSTPEFVVLFIPGEPFFAAALERDPGLIEEAARRQVILATPTTLIAVLWAIAHGWREERLAENARAISELGRELYVRLGTLAGHFSKLKRSIDGVVRAYNEAAGSLESRVLVSARRMKDLGATAVGEIEVLEPVEQAPRAISAPELAAPEPAALPESDAA
jgi:DNA recombination protein RmuC